MKFVLILFLSPSAALLFSSPLKAQNSEYESSSKFRQIVSRLPDQKLSLDLVLAKAMSSSESFRAVRAQGLAIDVERLQAESAFATQVFATGMQTKNENTQASLFDPRETTSVSVGANKFFASGTQLGLEIVDNRAKLQPLNTFQPPNTTTAKLSLQQSLWKDSFGYMSRRNLDSGEAGSRAAKQAVTRAVQDWTLALAKTYYGALLSRSQMLNAKEGLARRERLAKATRLKQNRGTAERPDVLQVESSLMQAKADFDQAAQDLQQIWRSLVYNLNLPKHWSEVPAENVPLVHDRIAESVILMCKDGSGLSRVLENSPELLYLKANYEKSVNAALAANNAYAPDVRLIGNIGSSGALGDFDARFDDAVDGTNVEWGVGLKVNMPLSWDAEKANLKAQTSIASQDEANYKRVKSDLEGRFANQCSNLKTLLSNRDLLEKSVQALSERAQLEEKRFSVGRVSTFNVILAGDELSQAHLKLSANLLALYSAAWEIKASLGQVEAYLETIASKYANLDILGEN